MNTLFEQSKALFTEQMSWYGEQASKAAEAMVADAEKAAKATHEAWSDLAQRQMGLATEIGKRTRRFVEQQVDLVEQALSSAA